MAPETSCGGWGRIERMGDASLSKESTAASMNERNAVRVLGNARRVAGAARPYHEQIFPIKNNEVSPTLEQQV